MEVLQRWPDGSPSVVRKPKPKWSRPALSKGDVVYHPSGDIYEVCYATPASAHVRCIAGDRVGKSEEWSLHAMVDELPTKGRAAAILARRIATDTKRCSNCWPNLDESLLDKKDQTKVRDLMCSDHHVSTTTRRARPKHDASAPILTATDVWRAVKAGIKAQGIKLPAPGKGHAAALRRLAEAAGVEIPQIENKGD